MRKKREADPRFPRAAPGANLSAMAYRDVPIAMEKCPGCYKEVPLGTQICPGCGNPVDISRYAELELKVKPDLRKARRFLGVVTALGAVGLLMSVAGENRRAAIDAAFSVAFFGVCFLVAFKRPLGASIAAMAIFLFGESVSLATGNVMAMFQGIVLKVIFLVLLTAGIRAGYRVRDLRGQWRTRDRTIGILVLAGSVVLGFLVGLAAHSR
jgi:hypothetical protein